MTQTHLLSGLPHLMDDAWTWITGILNVTTVEGFAYRVRGEEGRQEFAKFLCVDPQDMERLAGAALGICPEPPVPVIMHIEVKPDFVAAARMGDFRDPELAAVKKVANMHDSGLMPAHSFYGDRVFGVPGVEKVLCAEAAGDEAAAALAARFEDCPAVKEVRYEKPTPGI